MRILYTFIKTCFFACCFLSAKNSFSQNVGISSSSSFTPDASAALDVSYTSKGLLVPRVALTATNAAGPITSPATSLLIYNTATTGTSPNNVIPGYYYWNGSAWTALVSSAQISNLDWSLTGNTGTTAGTNFLGTTDATDLIMKTNNVERARIVGAGTTPGNFIVSGTGTTTLNTTNPEKLLVDAGTSSSFNVISGKGNLNNYLQLNIQNVNAGTAASSDVVASNDQGSESANFIDMGINSSANTSTGPTGGANTAYLYSAGNDFAIGNGAAGRNLTFFTAGTATTAANTERMRIDASGNVGIGTTTGNSTLSINGSLTYKTVTVSASYTATATDYLIINTGAGITVTLPAASTCPGRAYKILNHGTAALTVSPVITVANGSTGATLNATSGANFLEVISDGTVYRKISL